VLRGGGAYPVFVSSLLDCGETIWRGADTMCRGFA
jgi:hypothetical protein